MHVQIGNSEYNKKKEFLRAFSPIIFQENQLPDNTSVLMDEIDETEKIKESLAKKSVDMMMSDLFEMSSEWKYDRVREVDKYLSSLSVMTLSDARRQFWSRFKRIEKSGVIKNESEYYAVRAILENREIDNAEKMRLEAMLDKFEQSNRN